MTLYYDLETVTEKDFAREGFTQWFLDKVRGIQEQNRKLHTQHVEDYRTMLKCATAIYGEKSAEVKYLKSKKVENPPDFKRRVHNTWRRYEQWEEQQRERERQREYRERSKATNTLLQELGYVPGEHYSSTAAITFAKRVVNPVDPPVRMLPEGDN